MLPGREIYGILPYLKSGGEAPERGIAMQARQAAKKSIPGTEKDSTSEAEAGKSPFYAQYYTSLILFKGVEQTPLSS